MVARETSNLEAVGYDILLHVLENSRLTEKLVRVPLGVLQNFWSLLADSQLLWGCIFLSVYAYADCSLVTRHDGIESFRPERKNDTPYTICMILS
jgi:hypothetical protein